MADQYGRNPGAVGIGDTGPAIVADLEINLSAFL
jgi:hypothetical protein